MITMECPSCETELRIPDEYVGRRIVCRACKHKLIAESSAVQTTTNKAGLKKEIVAPRPKFKRSKTEPFEPQVEEENGVAHRVDSVPQLKRPKRSESGQRVATSKRFCRTCGERVGPETIVCMSCGAPPSKGKEFCPGCGAETNPAAAICLKCGVSFSSLNNSRIDPSDPPKDPVLMCLLSFLMVGLGQIVLGQVAKGITMFFGTAIGAAVLAVVLFFVICATGGLGVFVVPVVAPIFAVASAVDAYRIANKLKNGKSVGKWEWF